MTAKDQAGNPTDVTYNEAIYTSSGSVTNRSLFTDKGPIAKPALTVQSGTTVQIHTYTSTTFGPSVSFTSNEVTLTGGAFTPDHVGLCLDIVGTEKNDGRYRIAAVISAQRVRLQASFRLPDALNNQSSTSWKLINPRDGEIADDPADVVVRVNGAPVVPDAVIGLLGQVVLPSAPGEDDDVKIDYSWVANPTVDFRRLNSQEFVLNNWAYDQGQHAAPTQHRYRYRSTLIRPEEFVPEDIQSTLDSPLLRNVHYRAYERAYSALLNDPALLRLNTPVHRIAFPPLERTLSEVSVSYTATDLPENDSVPWERKGAGPASVGGGVLTIEDNTTGPFPGGNPLFWTRKLDLSFDHVFAATWRMTLSTVNALEGVYTGVSVGWSTDLKAVVLGYLEVNGVRKLGILKKGFGNDPSTEAAWAGGVDDSGTSTGLPADFDWSVLHSYRFFRSLDGVIRLYVDGEVSETLRLTEDDLPFLEELNTPFDSLHGVFFGSLSRPAKTISKWDFVRYVVLPTNPQQSAPSIFVSYEGDSLPETAVVPWTPVGYHGNEAVVANRLLLDSTSATDPSLESSVGLVGGDFRGFTRGEPLLAASSDVFLDAKFKILAHTHGITNDAMMLAVDDGYRLAQLSFFASVGHPKVSYPGRSLPEEASPNPWSKVGTGAAEMVGRTLRVTDSSTSGGLAYYMEDLAEVDSSDRVANSLTDYCFETRVKIRTYRPDNGGYCGATADVFDGVRSLGLQFRRDQGTSIVSGNGTATGLSFTDNTKNFTALGVVAGDELFVSGNSYLILTVSGSTLTLADQVPFSGSVSYQVRDTVRKVALHSDGVLLSPTVEYPFEWNDGQFHTYLVTKSSTNGTVVAQGFAGAALGSGLFNDTSANFITAGILAGDWVVVQSGPSTGAYQITAVNSAVSLTLDADPLPSSGIIYDIQRGRNQVVSLFADNTLLGSVDYSEFTAPGSATATFSFGSASAPSVQAASTSVVDWMYFNVWRTGLPQKRYAGFWKGFDTNSLTGYHLPTKKTGAGKILSATTLSDPFGAFTTAGVTVGDYVVIDVGPNKGDYLVSSVSSTQLTVSGSTPFSTFPTEVSYRVPSEIDWTQEHAYRLVRDPAGAVAMFVDGASTPSVRIPYSEATLPPSWIGIPSKVQGGVPSITWGALDPTNLSKSSWDYVRYGIVKSLTEDRIVPQHQLLNERNVMSSPEHLLGTVPHGHTQYSASSTGIPYPWSTYVENTAVQAYTQLNEGTPIVPMTQTYEVRRPTPVFVPVSALNSPSDILNSDGDFLLNDGTTTVQLLVPKDVLYSSLEVYEKTDGEENLLTPFTDNGWQSIGPIRYQKNVCFHYEGNVLPEDDSTAPTPWVFEKEVSANVTRSPVTGNLIYTADSGQTLYRNNTPLTDPVSLNTEVAFRLRLAADATTGTGDSGVRFGFSALGLTAALAFVTTPLGDREVHLLDLNANQTLGSLMFDFLDGNYHTYRLTKNVATGTIDFSIEP